MDDGTSSAESQILMSSTTVEESHDEAQTDNVNSGQSVEMPQPAPRKNSKKSVVEEEEEEEEEEDEDDEEFLSRRSKPGLKIIVHNEPSAAAAAPPVQSNTTLEMTAQTAKQEWSWNSSVQDSSNIIDEAKSECPDAPVAVKSDDLIEKKAPENVENFTKEMQNADSAETEKATSTSAMQTVEICSNQKIIVQQNSTNNATENACSNENDAASSTVIKSEPAVVDSEIDKQDDKIQNTVENETAIVKSEPESVKSEMEKQQLIEIQTTQESANTVVSAEPVSMVESETKKQVDQIQSDSSVSQQQNEAKIQVEEENAKSVVHIQTEQQQQQQVSAVEKSDDSKAEEQLANEQQQRVVMTSTDVGNVQNTTEHLIPVCSQEEKAEAPSNVEHVTDADVENVAKDVEKLGTSQSTTVVSSVQTTVFSSENEPNDKQILHNPTSTVVESNEGDNSTVTKSKIEISPIEVSSVKPIHYSSTGSKLTTEQSESNTSETSTKQQQHSADNLEANHQIGSAVSFESTVEDGYRKEVKTETKVSKSPNSSTTTKIISTTVKMEKQGAEAVPNMKDFIPAEMADLMKKMEQQHGSSVVFKDVQLMDKQSSTAGKTEQRFESTAQKADQANVDFSKPTSQSTFQSTEIPIERVLVDSDTHHQPTAQKTVTRIEKTRTYMKKIDDPTSWIQQESVAKNNWASSAPWAKATSTIAMPFPLPDDGKAQHYYKQVKTTTTTRTERSSTTAGAEPKTTVTASETVSQEGGKPSFDSWFGTVFVKPDMIRPSTFVEHQTADKSYSTSNAKAGASSFAEDMVSTTVPANVYSTHYSQNVVEIPPQQHHSAESTNSSRYTSNYSSTQTRSYQTSRPLNWQPSGQQQQQHQTFTEVPFSSHDQFVDRSWMGQQAKMPFAENANQSYSKSTYHSSQRSILKEQPALSTQWQQHATAYGNQLTGQPAVSQSKLFLGKMPGRMTTKWPPSNFPVSNEQEQYFHSSENSGMRRTNWSEDVGHAPPAGLQQQQQQQQQQQREEVGQQRQAPSTTGGSFWTVTTTRHHTSTAR
ncbi:hypothetical protein T11_7030 [Trichinella zimbabwensis]|uniref:Uncharacterized protein n=1 Tax=Trichinella zimbabwensis TaxID=268475 RepID=A0A0V1HCC9_9BILA|nr:hypothetical protein T11_7030 [Trichinella zimbabwensis]KRZ07872.1 hypothetical protein T11_7030 [Trichinella zimbabwensis]KRZ07873.1 hypothetical protein T11_7030 [Trichinella zimbabwensis]KRZ07874.1 hypothetical protein T11_7030 [Trichinella zimbabwensis]KRZ07875.1 hypothetical protein T11_7030 [Trichinella zimbabwensis]